MNELNKRSRLINDTDITGADSPDDRCKMLKLRLLSKQKYDRSLCHHQLLATYQNFSSRGAYGRSIVVAHVIDPGLAVKSDQTPCACSVQLPLVRHRHVVPARKRIGNPGRAHRIEDVALRAQDGRAQRPVLGLLNAPSQLSMIRNGDPALLVENACQTVTLVREEGDGGEDILGHVHDDEESVLGIYGTKVPVMPVLPVTSIAFSTVDKRRGLRCLRNLCFRGPFEI